MDASDVRGDALETHVSVLVFLGDRVLKLRKPLQFDFADFSSREARYEDCRREVALNRRLAPDVYLGVADIVLDHETVDHAVVMRRLPSDRSLEHLVKASPGTVPMLMLRAVARVLVDFHDSAIRSPEISSAADVDTIAREFDANVATTTRFVGPVLDEESHGAVVSSVHRFLSGRRPLFEARVTGGHVCDGHGDLQAADIYCLDDGPRILDCLEFDARLRYGDVAADVAFLAMDLERLGSPLAAVTFIREYEEAGGIALPPSLMHFYIALRAYVRVKVACLRYGQGHDPSAEEARMLLALARRHLDEARVRLVLIGGLPGAGKSTLARELSNVIGAEVLRSDDFRRSHDDRSADRDGPAPFQRGRYRPEATAAVYHELLGKASVQLGLGATVILDASFTDEARRAEVRRLGASAHADLVELQCVTTDAVRESRITRRHQAGTDPSEATVAVGRAMAAVADPWPAATAIDTSDRVRALSAAVRACNSPSP